MQKLLQDIASCEICTKSLPLGPRPIVSASPTSQIVIIGQAPGLAVHKSGIPWDDPSGRNLRSWMGIDEATFYDPSKIALIPMGFCYPGKGNSGDLPPRTECAPEWHNPILKHLEHVQLTLLIGKYAQNYYLQKQQKPTLTETVKNYEAYLPNFFVLPHPSPRNNIWRSKNPWFDTELLPKLKLAVSDIMR